LEARRAIIGSSDGPAVAGICPWKTALHVWLDKKGQLEPSDNQPMRWGRLLEDVVAEAYAEETETHVFKPEKVLEISKEVPYLGASIDRYASGDQEGRRILECKTASVGAGWGESGSTLIPMNYMVQVQHQMFVSGIPRADIAVLIGGNDLRIYPVAYSEKVVNQLLRIYETFWKHIQDDTPPPVDWEHPETPELVKLITPAPVEGSEVQLTGDAANLVRELDRLIQSRETFAGLKQIDKKIALVKAQLALLMGEAAVGVVDYDLAVHRVVVHRKGYTVDANSYTRVILKKNSVEIKDE